MKAGVDGGAARRSADGGAEVVLAA